MRFLSFLDLTKSHLLFILSNVPKIKLLGHDCVFMQLGIKNLNNL